MRVDLTNDSVDDLESVRMPAGWYLVSCAAFEKGTEHEELIWKFRVENLPFKGQVIESKLGNPEMAQTDKDAEGQWKRLKKWFKRLGILTDADAGKNVDINPAGCVGKKFVIELVDNWFEGKNGQKINIPRPSYLGVFPLDHVEIPPAERVRMGLALLPGQSAEPAAAAPAKPGRKVGGKSAPAEQTQQPAAATPNFDPSEV